MFLPILFIFLSTAVPSLAHPVGPNLDIVNERALGTLGHSVSLFQNVTHKCGTPSPSNELRQAHADFREQSRQKKEERQASSPIAVPTYVHFVSTIDQSHNYPPNVRNSMITSQVTSLSLLSLLSLLSPLSIDRQTPPAPQIAILTSLYRPAGISFRLASTTWTINDSWATDANSTRMKQALRRGSYGSLNLYFQTNLSTAPYTYSAASTLLGYCTLPTTITYPGPDGGKPVEYAMVDYATDGCNVLAGSMPKAPFPVGGYNLGKTAVHEVGHWFGLLHTFQVWLFSSSPPPPS